MKPHAFAYHRPNQLHEAFTLLATHADAKILAGGQSLIPTLNLRLSQPSALIDLSRLSELRGIRKTESHLVIGAMTRHAELGAARVIKTHFPALHEAIHAIAHPAIRNRGTIGGSLALADPAAEWPAAALAYDMRFTLASTQGTREVAAVDFFTGLYETALGANEVLTQIHLPLPGAQTQTTFAELARRSGDYAIVGAFLNAARTPGHGSLSGVRLAYFSVNNRPVLATRAMAALERTLGDAQAIDAAAACLQADLDPLPDLYNSAATKLHLAKVLLKRLVQSLKKPAQ